MPHRAKRYLAESAKMAELELEATGIITAPLEQLLCRYFRPIHITNAGGHQQLGGAASPAGAQGGAASPAGAQGGAASPAANPAGAKLSTNKAGCTTHGIIWQIVIEPTTSLELHRLQRHDNDASYTPAYLQRHDNDASYTPVDQLAASASEDNNATLHASLAVRVHGARPVDTSSAILADSA
ncbi:hypothetical protein HaLaN_21295, partial [Haematococcus lacustris]